MLRKPTISWRSPKESNPKVSEARDIALSILMRVERGAFAEKELDKMLHSRCVAAKNHSLATELVYGVLRWQHRLDDIIDRHARAPSKKMAPRLRQILRLAVYQYLFLSRIPPHAIVNEAVNQTRIGVDQKSASFVNAILRTVLGNEFPNNSSPCPDAMSLARWYSHPQWLVQRWIEQYGVGAAERALAANNEPAPLMCRFNGLKTTLRDLFASLEKEGMAFEPSLSPGAFHLQTRGRSVRSSPSYQRGLFSVQDIASQIIARLLQVRPSMKILDACAAPGGKTAHIADLAQNKAHITAVDSSEVRLADARRNLRRLGVKNVHYRVGDLTQREFVSTLGLFDRILVDAPCSGLGVLRRNPEARYRVKEEDLRDLAAKQVRITRALSSLLSPGGKMVYSVCTVTWEETREVISEVLAECPNLRKDGIQRWELEDVAYALSEDGCLETFPAPENVLVDGFFAARMVKAKRCEQSDHFSASG